MNLAPVRGSYLESYCGASPVCDPARAESPISPEPRATPWVPCSHSLRPVRAKVKASCSPTLLPLQGVGIYALIPRALPWALNWLPFQGAPFRALFVYQVRMLRHLLFDKNRAEIFLDFEHPTFQERCYLSTNLVVSEF